MKSMIKASILAILSTILVAFIASAASAQTLYYCDEDRDGSYSIVPSSGGIIMNDCIMQPGDDCNDHNPYMSPASYERCDGIDNNCNGETDEGYICGVSYFCDSDSDGFYNAEVDGVCNYFGCVPLDCVEVHGDDCQDNDDEIFPTQMETCNGIDDDCDDHIDEFVCGADDEPHDYYCDNDGDGYFSAAVSVTCQGAGCAIGCIYEPGDDCNDDDPLVSPGQEDICGDMTDNNCNGFADEDCGIWQCVPGTVYDCDTGLAGACSQGTMECGEYGMWDICEQVFRQSFEVCDNGIDDDCDGYVDSEDPICGEYYNLPPEIVSGPVEEAEVGDVYKYDAYAIDPNDDVLYYTLVDRPAGMSINQVTGMIRWIPQKRYEGTVNVAVKVEDPFGAYDIQEYEIEVADEDCDACNLPQRNIKVNFLRLENEESPKVLPGSQMFVDIGLENIGSESVEKLSVRFTIMELDVSRTIGPIYGFDDGDKIVKSVFLDIPNNAYPGSYTLRVEIRADDKVKRVIHREFTI